jgi:hypothetical protein
VRDGTVKLSIGKHAQLATIVEGAVPDRSFCGGKSLNVGQSA